MISAVQRNTRLMYYVGFHRCARDADVRARYQPRFLLGHELSVMETCSAVGVTRHLIAFLQSTKAI